MSTSSDKKQKKKFVNDIYGVVTNSALDDGDEYAILELDPEFMFRAILLFSDKKSEYLLESLGRYAKRHRKTIGKLTVDDVREVYHRLRVREVQNS